MSEQPFIPWPGQGPIPVAGDTIVEAKLRFGAIVSERADFMGWYWCRHSQTSFDIVAYRVPV